MEHTSTVCQTSRVTKGGRTLSYVLSVIQQPERARACGSGAKSSSDRRPVDPPPVVELKIYNEDGHKSEDITFAYEANFFLYASLEAARPISRGKLQHSSAQTPVPVLTGMPVSGTAYLDRPSEAGYFIFPDLSVRHEGQYILNFNLYEESKNDCDRDADGKPIIAYDPNSPDSSYDWRLEVKSNPFTVYSAKKFPGLTESTDLSKIVAEQGCRVRIRRDVRMRRRDQKSDEHMVHGEYLRCQEEEAYRERTRSESLSGSSDSSKFSLPDSSSSNNNHSSNLAMQSHHPHYHHQQHHHFARQPSLPRPHSHFPFLDYHHNQHHLHSATSPPLKKLPPPPPLLKTPTQSRFYHMSSSPSFPIEPRTRLPPVYPLSPPEKLREPKLDFGRSSVAGYGLSADSHTRLGPLSLYPPPPPPPRSPTSLSIVKLLSPIKLPDDHPGLCKKMPPISTSNNVNLSSSDVFHQRGTKRSISNILPDILPSTNSRLFNGHRPPSPLPHIIAVDDNENVPAEHMMIYKRASGAIRVRQLPVFH